MLLKDHSPSGKEVWVFVPVRGVDIRARGGTHGTDSDEERKIMFDLRDRRVCVGVDRYGGWRCAESECDIVGEVRCLMERCTWCVVPKGSTGMNEGTKVGRYENKEGARVEGERVTNMWKEIECKRMCVARSREGKNVGASVEARQSKVK